MKILYFGPIAKKGKPATGGFESANRKNIDELRRRGVDVIEFANPIIKRQLGSIAKLAYIKLFILPFGLLHYKGAKDVVIHITPLWSHLLWPSVLVAFMARLLNLPLLVDVRAGSLINLAKTKSGLWRRGVTYMFLTARTITVEGKSYVNDIPTIFNINKTIHYFPNITYCGDLNYQKREDEYVNMIYFGRITKAKGVDVLLKVMPKLSERYRLFLAGGLSNDIKAADLQIKNVFYLGALSPSALEDTLNKMHIFLFPTRWAGEGQSNSLIEAMQHGLVPITSDQGFCRDVVADCGIVLPKESTEQDYYDAIQKVTAGDWGEQGRRAMLHIAENHNSKSWIPYLITLYKEMTG